MDKDSKPTWLKIYYWISIILIILSIIIVITDKSGFAILAAGPGIIAAIILSALAYGVVYWKKNDKKILGNILLGIPSVISLGYLVWSLWGLYYWYSMKNTTVWFRSWPIPVFFLILSTLFIFLLLKLNKKE